MKSYRCFGLAAVLAFASIASVGCSSAAPDETDGAAGAEAISERPPQFVLLAFDGSLSIPFWEESRAFAKANNVEFTYFISGVYFLQEAKKTAYHGPQHGAGVSEIGFGGAASAIAPRFQELVKARAEGHEMGSHASGHFDGTRWSESDWETEFQQFDNLIFHGAETTGLPLPDLGFSATDLKGFRAPQLGQGPPLYKVLASHAYAYDTSKTSARNYWPQKLGGIWNFPLAQLKIVGSGKNTLSMDFNFYITQSKAESHPENKDQYKKEMLDTYMQYFQDNYFGNRAPVSIGHHFSKWNGGAYWEALQEFAKKVCRLPEVKCVTYSELMGYMEAHQDQREAFQAGQFPQMPRPPGAAKAAEIEAPVADEDLAASGFVGDTDDACADDEGDASN